MSVPLPGTRATRRFTTAGASTVIHADLDGDGALDIALLDPAGGRVLVWLGGEKTGYSAPGETPASVERLTPRETQVAVLIAAGYTDAEIADLLGIGRRTAETHAARVLGKLELRSRRDLIKRSLAPARA